MKNNYSRISIIISTIILLVKLIFEIYFYTELTENFSETSGDVSPTVVAGGIKSAIIILSLPFLISLIFAILGIINKNKRRFFALFLAILTLIVFITPISLFIFVA